MKRTAILAACGLAVGLAGTAFAQDTIWGIDNSRNVLGTFTSAAPGTFNDVGPTGIGTGFTNSLEFDGNGDLWASDGTQLFSINTSTGAGTLVGSHGNLSGETLTDFTWDGSTMWAIGTQCGVKSSLWNVNLATGAASFVCQTDIGGACDVGLTVGADGAVYGHDLVTDTIYEIDVNTCATTTIINIAFDTNFGQGLTASSTTNYHVAFNNTAFQGQLLEFDAAGNHTLLGALGPLQIAAADVEGGGSCLQMTVSSLVAGQSATWDVSGATPGARVAVVYGFQPGTTVVSGTQGYCATFGIKGVKPSQLICQKASDGNGDVSCRVPAVPSNARGKRVLSQAAEQGTCPDECVSNLDDQVVQ